MSDVENEKFIYFELPEGNKEDPELANKVRLEADQRAQQNIRNLQNQLEK